MLNNFFYDTPIVRAITEHFEKIDSGKIDTNLNPFTKFMGGNNYKRARKKAIIRNQF